MTWLKSKRFGFRIRWILRCSGWCQNAKRAVPWDELPKDPFPIAEKIVEEFYGLTVGGEGAGKQCGRVTLTFDPRGATESLVAKISADLGIRVYPLGAVDRGHADLFVTLDGRIYMWFEDPPILVASSFDDALTRMLLGLRYEGV